MAEKDLQVKEESTVTVDEEVEATGGSDWSKTVVAVVWAGMFAFMFIVYWVMNNVNFNKVPKI